MKIVKIKIDDVKPYENNVKLHPQEQIEQIKKSILDFGNNDPIAVDENNVIIEGHGRFMALQELGYKEVECIVLTNLNENQKNAYRLVHNKLTMNSDFDLRGLEEELNKIQIDMSPFEFDMKEIEKEISKLNDKERELEEDDIPEPPSNPISKIGDIWQLGRHRLMCGDSTNSDIDKLMEDMQCDLFLTDPPYNVNYKGNAGTIENDNQSSPAFRTFLYQAFHNAYDFMKSGAVFYIFHADLNGYDFRWACEENALKVRQCLIWEKSSLVLGRQDYQCIHEPILYGWKEGTHNWYSNYSQTTCLHFDKPRENKLHPTMKPIKLIEYLMQNSSKENDTILDLFGGSGTTLIVAEQMNRTCFMMEIDPRYVDVIIERWEKLTGRKAVKL